ncbi:hypothetical protein ACP70R_002253 [Stipagrostis hirtigluma subsp. patula]
MQRTGSPLRSPRRPHLRLLSFSSLPPLLSLSPPLPSSIAPFVAGSAPPDARSTRGTAGSGGWQVGAPGGGVRLARWARRPARRAPSAAAAGSDGAGSNSNSSSGGEAGAAADGPVSHGSLKASNILFTAGMDPCISEYGVTAPPLPSVGAAGDSGGAALRADVRAFSVMPAGAPDGLEGVLLRRPARRCPHLSKKKKGALGQLEGVLLRSA